MPPDTRDRATLQSGLTTSSHLHLHVPVPAPQGPHSRLWLCRDSPPLEVDARHADVWRTLHPGHLLLTRSASISATHRLLSAYVVHSDSTVTDEELRHLGCIAAFLLAVSSTLARSLRTS